MDRDDYLTSTALKERGWSDALIRDFAAEPCKLVKNPAYRSGPPMRLWGVERIKIIEATPEWQERSAKIMARRPAAQARALAAAEKKRQETIAFVRAWVPKIRLPDGVDLVSAACEAYNALHDSRGNYTKFATPDANPEFIERIVTNYVRHECSDYEWMLSWIKGRVGAGNSEFGPSPAYEEIRALIDAKVDEAIASARGGSGGVVVRLADAGGEAVTDLESVNESRKVVDDA